MAGEEWASVGRYMLTGFCGHKVRKESTRGRTSPQTAPLYLPSAPHVQSARGPDLKPFTHLFLNGYMCCELCLPSIWLHPFADYLPTPCAAPPPSLPLPPLSPVLNSWWVRWMSWSVATRRPAPCWPAWSSSAHPSSGSWPHWRRTRTRVRGGSGWVGGVGVCVGMGMVVT
jgi:hypothetical protein